MSLLKKAAVFIGKELASNLTAEFAKEIGQHVGDAVGTLLGRRVDPEHGKDKEKAAATPTTETTSDAEEEP